MAKLRVDKIAAPIVKDEFTGSVHFDGTTQNRITIPSTTDFAPGTGDFTIEMWVYHTNLTGQQTYFGDTYGNTSGIYTYKTSNNEISLYDSAQRSLSAQNVIKLNTWHHIAWTRESGVLRAFVDGVIVDEDTYTGNFTDTDYFIGDTAGTSSGEMVGYISNLRYCKLHAVYTSNFTVPTRELEVHTGAKGVVFPTADNRTTLLACQSSTDATADATGRHILTASSGVTAADANPGLLRKTNTTSTITETTGSVYFDGSNDGLRSNPYDELTLGTGAFTIECWFWRQNITDNWGVLVADNLYQSAGGWSLYTQYDDIRFWKGGAEIFTVSNCYSAQTWTHIAVQRDSAGSWSCYINGIDQGVSATDSVDFTDNRICIGTNNYSSGYPNQYNYNGYISNVRICKGHAVYKSQFIPPTRELEVHPGPTDDKTVFLACYDGENVFAEKTGKIIAANGDRTSSPTPTATDSPIGITTNSPGLIREVDPVEGPTFGGGVGFVSQNWLTLPKGTTTQRSRGRGLIGGGYTTNYTNTIEYIEIHTLGNGQDFGDLSIAKAFVSTNSSSTRCVFSGGYAPSASRSEIEYVNISTTGNVTNFGTAVSTQHSRAACGNNTRGIIASGSASDAIEYITFSTIGQSNVFGTYTIGQYRDASGCSSPTRGIFAGGFTPANTNSIQYVTISTIGNTQDFGDLSSARYGSGATSSETRGVFFGGTAHPSSSGTNIIEYITISTQGNTTDFGDLTRSSYRMPCTSNGTRAVAYTSSPSPGGNAIEYVTIATTGNASDFGDSFINAREYSDSASSDSHGGIS
jgi:hypothetical protein